MPEPTVGGQSLAATKDRASRYSSSKWSNFTTYQTPARRFIQSGKLHLQTTRTFVPLGHASASRRDALR